MLGQKVFKPRNLLVIDNDLVAGEVGIAKDGRAKTDNI